jgi:uncharacterized membrane protein YqaE (UPF0057 family)
MVSAKDIISFILAFFLPPLAVFIERGIGADLIINIILTILGWIPGIIHAFCESSVCPSNTLYSCSEFERSRYHFQVPKPLKQ